MAEKYTEQEIKEFNTHLRKLQNRAKRLILSDYYDHIRISDLQTSILQQITNAETYKDISPYLWSSGIMEDTLESISEKIKQARKEDRKRVSS